MKKIIIQSFIIVSLLISSQVYAATYYIDYETGSDANNGLSKSTPWKRAPGMQGCSANCAAYETAHNSSDTTGAGNSFLFKGGVTWPNTVMSWDWNHGGGTKGNPITFGVDETWYTGGSWTRPIFDAENAAITPDPVTSNRTMIRFYNGGSGYFVVDNFEITGLAQLDDTTGIYTMLLMQTRNFEVKNCYFHGWSHGGTATKERSHAIMSNLLSDVDIDSSIHDCVIDGSDTTKDMLRAYKGSAGHFYNNYVRDVYNGMISTTTYVWGNTFIDIGATFDSTGHGNVVENISAQLIIYNNYISGADGGANIYHTPKNGLIDYNFNNVIVNEDGQAIQIGTLGLTDGIGSGIYVFNNTIQSKLDNNATPINGPSKVGDASLPFMRVYNNHLIANNTSINFGTQVTEGNEIESNNIGMTNAEAQDLNYVSSSKYIFYAPNDGGVTYKEGMDLHEVAAGIPSTTISDAAAAAILGSSCGVKYDSINHRVVGPMVVPTPRGSKWDVGAYKIFLPPLLKPII